MHAESPISGAVTTEDGQPIPGVVVIGSMSKNCCPFKRDETITDQNGRFRIEHPGEVIHFFKRKLKPRTIVVAPSNPEIQIVLQTPKDDLVIPACGVVSRGQKRIGWGKYGLQFNVLKRAVNISGGKTDVDYVHYVIKPKAGEGWLELWFGVNAMGELPDDDQFVSSERYSHRNVFAPGMTVGLDSWGETRGGGEWRQTAVAAFGGAKYRSASPEQTRLFDEVVNSMCMVPFPNR
jgi:hypothetical protein